ncbi:MAG: DUF3566 domain-containing protein [Propionibacteriaceae bacterium]|jgi:hypothetical protein|nr:DUF3566 domain-containing protein [Propionibacteriaceae bacterium]
MIDNFDPASADAKDSDPGVGVNIAQSLKNRVKRMTSGPKDPGEIQTPAQFDSPAAPLGADPLATQAMAAPVMAAESRVSTPKPSTPKPATTPRPKPGKNTRRARLRVSRVDPWSVMKIALLFSVAAWIMLIVSIWIIFTILEATDLYDAINTGIAQVFASPETAGSFNIKELINTTRATAFAALIGAVNVVIMTALATVFAFLYNLAAVVMGGIEVTMAED